MKMIIGSEWKCSRAKFYAQWKQPLAQIQPLLAVLCSCLVAMVHYSDYCDFSFTSHSEVEEFLFHMSQILENWAP